MFYSIEMLRAGAGDCFWIECGHHRRRPFRIVIDAGVDGEILLNRLKGTREEMPINLWIITHIDDDHIRGALNLASLGRVEEVWFNAPSFRRKPASWVLTYSQGADLAEILRLRHDTKWNSGFPSGQVKILGSGNASFRKRSFPGVTVSILAPTGERLKKLFAEWRLKSSRATLGERETEHEERARVSIDDALIQKLATDPDLDQDRSIPNCSSIVVLLEFSLEAKETPKRYLFGGDAPPSVLIPVIKKLKGKNEKLRLDGFKLSHHGSRPSISTELLELLDCGDYYISTKGNQHGHPHDTAVAKTIVHGKARNLYFNYAEPGQKWKEASKHSTMRFQVKLATEPSGIVVAKAEFIAKKEPLKYWPLEPPGTAKSDRLEMQIINVAKNLKVVLNAQVGNLSKTFNWIVEEQQANMAENASNNIRQALSKLAEGWPQNQEEFSTKVAEIARRGQTLYYALFPRNNCDANNAKNLIEKARPKTPFTFRTSDESADIALPLVCTSVPGKSLIENFWANRYSVSTLLERSGYRGRSVALSLLSFIGHPATKKELRTFGKTYNNFGKLSNDWESQPNTLVHFYCHGDGYQLRSEDLSQIIDSTLLYGPAQARTDQSLGPDVLFLNACDTWTLRKDLGWKLLFAEAPFHGFIGTEAELDAKAAAKFASFFFEKLREKMSVAEAFESARHGVWPAGLFYGLYLDPALARAAHLELDNPGMAK